MLLDSQLDQQPDDTHRDIWRWLDKHAAGYPVGLDVPPLKPPKTAGRVRRWGAIEVISVEAPGENVPHPVRIDVASGGAEVTLVLPGTDDDARLVGAALFSRKARGTAYVLGHGGRRDLHILFRRYYRAWVGLGYEVAPVVAGSDVKLITVRRDRHAWHLVDWHGLTGLEPAGLPGQVRAFGEGSAPNIPRALGLLRAVEGYAAFVRATFGVEPRLTLGQTAVAAASQHVPEDRWLWRPNRLALALCREGGAFRGGYCYYPSYRGPGYKIDMRRAYAWALTQPLPCGSARGPCVGEGYERPGVYVCEVRGPGCLPAYLAVWQPGVGGFQRKLWSGDVCHAVLPASEFAGLRALGYVVRPGWGSVYLRSFELRGLVRSSEDLIRAHGPDSALALAGKLLVNAVYGKLAERPDRDGIVFSAEPPSEQHLPFTTADGEEVEGAWCEPQLVHRSHQHVDVAAEICALVRGRLYEAAGKLIGCGIGVLAGDTDGLVLTSPADGAIPLTPDVVGGWRNAGYDPNMVIAAPRFATWRGRALIAGTSRQDPEVVAVAYERGVVSVEGKVMAPPWQGGAMVRKVRRRLRRTG